MNETATAINPELEHDDCRGNPARAVTPSHADTQRACAIANSIEAALFARLDEVDAKHGPGTCHRLELHRHVVAVLADHRETIANALAGVVEKPAARQPFVVGDSVCGDPARVCSSTSTKLPTAVYDDAASGYDASVYGPDDDATDQHVTCDVTVFGPDGTTAEGLKE